MVSAWDFIALAVWLALLPVLKRAAERDVIDLEGTDLMFVALVLLVCLQLLWLRIGYAPP
jgi:hypothetical protein